MIQTLEILKGYITCEDPATRNKFFNLLDSFWHKNDGKVLKETVIGQDGSTTFKFLNADGSIHSVALPALPNSKPISFIENLAEELGKLQPKVPGKGLSTNDFTAELYQKLQGLKNYLHPEFHQIAEIEFLPEQLENILTALAGKQPIADEGWGFSQENYTLAEKTKLSGLESSKWKGNYPTLEALKLAFPEGIDQNWHQTLGGWYVDVDAAAGEPVQRYIWDANDLIWTLQLGSSNAETAASVKLKYESNPDTNAFTDARRDKVDGLPANVESTEGAQAKATAAKDVAIEHANTADEALKEQIDAKADASHYGAQVADLAALKALSQAEIPNGQRRNVYADACDYIYKSEVSTAGTDNVAPDDQVNGTGFWVKATPRASTTQFGLSGVIDGVNTTFTTAKPFKPGNTKLYLNGIRQYLPDDYAEPNNTTIEFVVPPQVMNGDPDKIILDY